MVYSLTFLIYLNTYLFINGENKIKFMAFLNGAEWIIIILIIVILFFGAKKIPELANLWEKHLLNFKEPELMQKRH